MDDFDDIVLDNYDSYLGGKNGENNDDPLDMTSSNNDTKSKKRSKQNDGDDDADDAAAPTKKQRSKLKKLDHKVLLSSEGLLRLRNETPWLEFKDDVDVGENLEKLMQYYRSWAYKIYPRFNFPDFASKVMKTTANKECKGALKNWRDEYIFKNSGDMGDTSIQDNTAGGLSGLTLEDEEKNSQDSDDKKDSSDDDDNSDQDDGKQSRASPKLASNDGEPRQNGNADDEAWAAMMDADLDEEDGGALFVNPPVTANRSMPFSTNNLSVDDFFAD